MAASDIYLIKEPTALYFLAALETFEKELSQLEKTHEWFASDARPLLEECKGIIKNLMEIEDDEQSDEEDYWDEQAERLFAELCIDRERDRNYWGEDEDDQ